MMQKLFPKSILKRAKKTPQNGAKMVPGEVQKSCPGAPEGTPRALGPPRELRWTPQDLILAAPEVTFPVPGTLFH